MKATLIAVFFLIAFSSLGSSSLDFGEDYHLYTLTMGVDLHHHQHHHDSFFSEPEFNVISSTASGDPFHVAEPTSTWSTEHTELDHSFSHNFDHFRPEGILGDISPATAFILECNPFAFASHSDHHEHHHDHHEHEHLQHYNHDHHHFHFHHIDVAPQADTKSENDHHEQHSEEAEKLIEFVNKANKEWQSGSIEYPTTTATIAPSAPAVETLKKKVSILLKPATQPSVRRQMASSVFSSSSAASTASSNVAKEAGLMEDLHVVETQEVAGRRTNQILYYLMAVVLGMSILSTISALIFLVFNKFQKSKNNQYGVSMSLV